MPQEDQAAPVHLEDFSDLLTRLEDEGLAFVVIGGCAVGAYARGLGATVISRDLDLYATHETLCDVLALAPAWGAKIVKRPMARAVPVAVLDWRGQEVNILTASAGLARPDVVIEGAREVELVAVGLRVALADPFDLLANKLAVRRAKDLPHIELLRRFIEAEVVERFSTPGRARDRLAAARRWLEVEGWAELPQALVIELPTQANLPALRRFLASKWPSGSDPAPMLAKADNEEERDALRHIIAQRRTAR